MVFADYFAGSCNPQVFFFLYDFRPSLLFPHFSKVLNFPKGSPINSQVNSLLLPPGTSSFMVHIPCALLSVTNEDKRFWTCSCPAAPPWCSQTSPHHSPSPGLSLLNCLFWLGDGLAPTFSTVGTRCFLAAEGSWRRSLCSTGVQAGRRSHNL